MKLPPFIAVCLLLACCCAGGAVLAQETQGATQIEAEQGNAKAQYRLGLKYYRQGGHVEDNRREALKWFHKAVDQGYAPAAEYLGVMYENGEGVAQDYAQAAKWFLFAADSGSTFAPVFLGEMYETGKGVTQDYAAAAKWYLIAADKGNSARAQWHLGQLYYQGAGVKQDTQKALDWELEAADKRYKPAFYTLGVMYADMDNYPEAVKWFREAARQRDVASLLKLGGIYYEGKTGVAQSYSEAAKWYQSAAALGSTQAQNDLSKMYYDGLGVPRDYASAYMWASFSAAQDDKEGRSMLDHLEFVMRDDQKTEAQDMARQYRAMNPSLGR